MNNSANIVEVISLRKMYKNADSFAIDNLSFKIKKGEIFGLLGPNGAGKTTTIKILTGLLEPNLGEVLISGLSIKNSSKKIKSLIGVVPQEIALYPSLTTLDNLRIFGTLYSIPSRELKVRILDLLQVYGLETKSNQKVKDLSGGMKRRLNIIAGILHSPQLLILDEPTAGIDVQSKKFILANLKELNRLGTTILYTSHFMEEAEKFCTDIAIIDQGRVIANNTPEKLINQTDGCVNLEEVFLKLTGRHIRE
jgi:ABC-2 type transport system ATP-binding protein